MGNHCRLYDENIVRNIMISTGVSIMEFVKDHKAANTDQVCKFIENNAEHIISETIKNLDRAEKIQDDVEEDAIGDDDLSMLDEDEMDDDI